MESSYSLTLHCKNEKMELSAVQVALIDFVSCLAESDQTVV